MTAHHATDEKDLLLRLRQGDRHAFEKIYGSYSTRIYSNITRLVHDEDVAADLLQDLFIKVWERRADIDADRSFRSFLFTCSRNLVYNYLRRVSLEKQVELYLGSIGTELYEHVEQDMQYRQTSNALRSAIAKLPEQRRKVYTLCKVDGLSYEEVAQQLGISRSAVKDHIVKGNRFIGRYISSLGHTSIAVMISYTILR